MSSVEEMKQDKIQIPWAALIGVLLGLVILHFAHLV
jgi:hypothetical protein